MADYYTPTVVQQSIPTEDMTPLERLVLSLVFDAEPDGDALYFFSEVGPSDMIWPSSAQLRAAYEASAGVDSTLAAYIAEKLAAEPDGDTEIELDMSEMSWEIILQDIVRRSRTLEYITVVSAFTCSRMRVDGYGGMAVHITSDVIQGKSTHDILEDFLATRDDGRSA